jgi:1-acyl-sn-glycerol-3-phosphate acyltransferase
MIRRPPSPLLYELVGVGMTAYARLVHRTVVLGVERLRLEPGVVLVSTHLSDADVPVLGGALYGGARMWGNPTLTRPSFAVGNDLLLPGYLAGYPRRMPLALRRALWPLGIGPVMRRWVRCLPVRHADRLRLVEALRSLPDLDLAEALPPAQLQELRRRAAGFGEPTPRVASDVLDGRYADLLWQDLTRAELDGPALAGLWDERLRASAVDLRQLIRHVRGGGALILFPHGELSPDGAIGPLDPRPARLLRLARPTAVQPLAIAHDPLAHGRPRAFVGIGEARGAPSRKDGARELLGALRQTMPLACGLAVAHALAEGDIHARTETLSTVLERAVERARRDGRPIEPALEDDTSRRARVEEAVRAVQRLGITHPAVKRAARTHATMLEPAV